MRWDLIKRKLPIIKIFCLSFSLYIIYLFVFSPKFKPLIAQDDSSRWGIGLGLQGNNYLSQFDYQSLNIGFYFDWGYWNSPIGNIKYYPLVGGYLAGTNNPKLNDLEKMVLKNPQKYPDGTLWFVGNEPGIDDGRSPNQYAKDYHDYYYKIKELGKRLNFNYQVVAGSFMTTSRIKPHYGYTGTEYLNLVRNEYRNLYQEDMPVDAYSVDAYVFDYGGTNIEEFKSGLIYFRQHLKSIGEQEKPLIIKEIGVLFETTPKEEVKEFMYKVFDFLTTYKDKNLGCLQDEGRLVQKWAWFVLNDGEESFEGKWDNTSLFDSDSKRIKPLGQAFIDYRLKITSPTPTVTQSLVCQQKGGVCCPGSYGVCGKRLIDPWVDKSSGGCNSSGEYPGIWCCQNCKKPISSPSLILTPTPTPFPFNQAFGCQQKGGVCCPGNYGACVTRLIDPWTDKTSGGCNPSGIYPGNWCCSSCRY